jgi:hypothetical protein
VKPSIDDEDDTELDEENDAVPELGAPPPPPPPPLPPDDPLLIGDESQTFLPAARSGGLRTEDSEQGRSVRVRDVRRK